jgi:hypothetical protein
MTRHGHPNRTALFMHAGNLDRIDRMPRAMDDTVLHAIRAIDVAEQSLGGSCDKKAGTGAGIFTGI